MGFDISKFRKAKFQPRTADIQVPELADFFADGEDPVITVRGLDAVEFARVQAERNGYAQQMVRGVVNAAGTGDIRQIMESVRDYISAGEGKQPADIIQRIYLIEFGTVSPELEHEDVLKLRKHSEIFYRLSNKILELTGQGPTLGE